MQFGFGSGILTGIRTDVSGATPIRFGALQDVAVDFAGDIKELYSLGQFPLDTARGKTKVTGKAKVAQVRGQMYADLFFGQAATTGGLNQAYNESIASAGSGYTVANAASTPLTDLGVFYGGNGLSTDGNQFVLVGSSPTAGQYTFVASTGVYGFSTFDAGLNLFVNYNYTVTSGYHIDIRGDVLMGETPRFQADLFMKFEGKQIVLVLFACVSTRLSFPTRIDDYTIQDLDFSAFSDASGRLAKWSTAQ